MWPMIGMVAGSALGSIAGSAISGGLSYASAREAHRESIEAYKHRYQWQKEDMLKAGINPALAYASGAPAAPMMSATHVPDPGLGEAVSRGASARLMSEQIKTEKDEQQLLKAREITETWNAASARVQAYFDDLVANFLSGNKLQRMTPQERMFAIGRAATQAGLAPSSALGASARAISSLVPAGRAARAGGAVLRHISR